jgi:SAM-dependent methyltransferase
MRDVWQSAKSYEAYIGRWSRPVAREFVAGLRIAPESAWIDIGCGSGALTSAILAIASPVRVAALDRSFDFVEQSRRAVADHRVLFAVADAVQLPFADGCAHAAVSGLVLNFVPEPERAVREMLRCVRPGGLVAVYVWDYAGGMQAIRRFWDAAIALDRGAAALDEAERFPLCQPSALEKLFRDAGVSSVSVSSITVPTVFRDFDDLWSPFLGGQGPAPTYAMSLDEKRRGLLREKMRNMVPVKADGSIEMSARAWIARAVRSVE